MKLVMVSNLNARSTFRPRYDWMVRLGYNPRAVDQNRYFPFRFEKFWQKVEIRIGYGPSYWAFNKAILEAVTEVKPDVLWVERGVFVWPGTLKKCRPLCGRLVSIHFDDPFTRRGRKHWRHHLAGVRYYDVCFAAIDGVVEDYLRLEVPHVYRIFNSYDPMLHRPLDRPVPIPHLGESVVFLGHYEPERVPFLEAVLEVTPRLHVQGEGWERCLSGRLRQAGVLHHGNLWLDDYAAALSQGRMVLGLLSRNHRDLSTRRSFEIPACAGFMLAERTTEHQRLYREGVEAEFFGNLEELQGKVQYYLEHPEEARTIGQKGRQRCLEGGYGFDRRLPRWMAFALNPTGRMGSDFDGL